MPKPLTKNPDGTPHRHIYIRRNAKSYKCANAECSHWMPKADLKGKQSICSKCFKNTILLDWKQLQLARPHCLDCSNSEEAQRRRNAIERLSEMGIA